MSGQLALRFDGGVRGPTAPLVLVHGIISGRYLVPLARALSSWGRVLVPELPGFGDTPPCPDPPDVGELAGQLAAWLERHEPGGAVLVGHSTGCQVVIELALRRPDLLRGAALMGPTGDPSARTVARHWVRWLRCQVIEPFGFTGVLTREFLDGHAWYLLRVFARLMDDPVEAKAAAVGVPVLVVRGERDYVAPRAWARRLTGLLPEARFVEIPRAAHTLHDRAPDSVARVLWHFAAALPAPRPAGAPPDPRIAKDPGWT